MRHFLRWRLNKIFQAELKETILKILPKFNFHEMCFNVNEFRIKKVNYVKAVLEQLASAFNLIENLDE